jgi:hypothetical protein
VSFRRTRSRSRSRSRSTPPQRPYLLTWYFSECCKKADIFYQISRLLSDPNNATSRFAHRDPYYTAGPLRKANPEPWKPGCQYLAIEQPYNAFNLLPDEEGGPGVFGRMAFVKKPR